MIERAFVHITGPSGVGKTTLIERLLHSNFSKLLSAIRAEEDEKVEEFDELAMLTDPELQRYHEAGAAVVARYRFSPDTRKSDAFFTTDFMFEYSEGVLIEGDLPLGFPPSLTVYVAKPPAEGTSLLRRLTIDRAAMYASELDYAQKFLRSPDGVEKILKSMTPELFDMTDIDVEILGKVHESVLAKLEKKRGKGPLPPVERWMLTEGYSGIESARVVVVNVRSETDRRRAESLLADLKLLREEKDIFDDIIGWKCRRTPITTAAADISNPKDKELRRIITRIKRTFVLN